jgi:hypothetical protein
MKTLFSLVLFLLTFAAFAQEEAGSTSMITVSGGLSIATGGYTDVDFEEEPKTPATTGGYGEIAYYKKLKDKKWGFLLGVRLNSNSLDKDKAEDELEELSGQDEWSVDKSAYSTTSFNVGLFLEEQISETAFLRLRGTLGYAMSKYAEMNIEYQSEPLVINVNADNASSVCFSIGGAVRFKMSEKIGLILEADYFGSKPEFETEIDVEYDGITAGGERYDVKQPITTIGLGVGVAFMLK